MLVTIPFTFIEDGFSGGGPFGWHTWDVLLDNLKMLPIYGLAFNSVFELKVK